MIRKSIKVLVIDDLQDNLTSLNALINNSFPEATVLNALNGKKGIEIAIAEDPDLILLDILMPIMDGYEVCTKLKESAPLNAIPVVIVTASDKNKESLDRASKCGADAFLAKPINDIELMTTIKAMVKVKMANVKANTIQLQLDELVEQRTKELNKIHLGTLNILEDLQRENKSRAKSEGLNRSITQGAADAIISINTEGKILSWNNAAQDIFGYSSNEMLQNNLDLIMPQNFINDHNKGLKRLVEGGVPKLLGKKVEISAIRKGGQEFPIELSLSRWTSEKEDYYTGIIRDISERRRSQQIQTVIHRISNATLSTDSLEKLHGIIKEELSKIIDTTNYYIALYDELTDTISLQYFVDENDDVKTFPSGKTLTSHVIKTKKSLLATETKQIKMAHEGLIELVGTRSKVWLGVPLLSADKIMGVVAVQSYINENDFNQSDKELLEIIAHQIRISIDRKKSEEELKKALINATESDRLKSAFLATMSHELRTPLNAIIGFSDFLVNETDIDEVNEYAKIINQSGNNLLSIIEEIFDITLIESGKSIRKIAKGNLHVSLNEIHKLAKLNQSKLSKTHIGLHIELPKEHEELIIRTDFAKLKHVLLSLLNNALKFSNSGQVNYGYRIVTADKTNPMLEFYVDDTGIGISDKNQQYIFETFRQVEETNTRRFGGIGVGLSIAKRLVNLLGGEIWVKSEQGVGSTFFFTIPLDVDQNNQNLDQLLSSKLVLIVEDDRPSYEFLKIIIEGSGMKTLYAPNGLDAIDRCKAYPDIDLILMDINMPVMNGHESVREIRKFNKEVKIIAQTAYAFEKDKIDAIDSGCDDFIAKPIVKDNLIRIIKKYVN